MNALSRRITGRAFPLPPSFVDMSADFPLLLRLPDRSLFSLVHYTAACPAPQEPLAVAVRLEVCRPAAYAVRVHAGGTRA